MKARHLLAACTALIVGTTGLAACGGGGADDDANTLTFWHNSTTGEGKQFWEDTAADFEAAHPGVTVEIQAVQNEDLDGKLQTALNSGTAPDVFLQRGGGKMLAMVEAGQLLDVTGAVDDATAQLLPAGALTAGQVDGVAYSVPVTVQPGGFFYSKDLFAAAGVDAVPTTTAELDAAVTALKASGVAPIALGAKDAWPAAHYYYFYALRECSRATLEGTATTFDFSDPCWLAAGEDLQALAATEPFNEGFLTTSAQQGAGSSAGLVANHQAAMELMGAWDPGVIASLTPDEQPLADLAWFAFPAVDGGAGDPAALLGGVDGFSCSAQAPAELCKQFLGYLVTTDVQKAYYEAFDTPPVNTDAQAEVTEEYLVQIIEAFNQAPYVSQWLDTLYGQNIGNALNAAVVEMLAGQGDPQGVVDAVAAAAAKE